MREGPTRWGERRYPEPARKHWLKTLVPRGLNAQPVHSRGPALLVGGGTTLLLIKQEGQARTGKGSGKARGMLPFLPASPPTFLSGVKQVNLNCAVY